MSNCTSGGVSFFSGENVPLEMHKVRMVQKLNLPNVEQRVAAIKKAGNNTFLLKNDDVFLDMLTDSGVNAMSDRQYAAMFIADDSYAGSATFYRLQDRLENMFGTKFFLPAHQGRACENIISNVLVKPGQVVPMNYHFTTTKAHITRLGGTVEELINEESLKVDSQLPFKGNMDVQMLKARIAELGSEKFAFVRLEAGTNLIGGQPISMENMRQVSKICKENNILSVLDASLLADNLYFIKVREPEFKDVALNEITREIGELFDLIYFSGRKLGCSKGGGIVTNNETLANEMKPLVTLYEGFLTYGGMSVREMEALAVGLDETLDMGMISQTPMFVEELSRELIKGGVPVVTPAGGLGCHIDASRFVSHIPQEEYPAGALAAAIYIVSGIRGMERGTMSEQRNPDGSESLANMELVRLAVPRRVFTLSQIKFVADRIIWLHKNSHLIEGLKFENEPETLRFFFGTLSPVTNWQDKLVEKFLEDMPSGI